MDILFMYLFIKTKEDILLILTISFMAMISLWINPQYLSASGISQFKSNDFY